MRRGLLQRVAHWARAVPLAGGRLALVLIVLAMAQPAQAQERATAYSVSQILDPILVTNQADMNFGNITPRGTNGTVVLTANATATCTTTGTLLRVGTCRAARFEGDTSWLFFLRVTKPVGGQINLTGPAGATMRLDNFTFAGGPGTFAIGGGPANEQRFVILNGDGTFTVYVGGTLNVAGNQRPGIYTGTFQLTFNYD